jgi:heme/copper-type cytochrome/quinol oxidase subunit 3
MQKHKVMMAFFIASEAIFFIGLIVSYMYYNHLATHSSLAASYLDIKKTGFFTAALILSSVTMHIAGVKFKNGDRKIGWVIFTIILGIIFLIGQGSEYARLYSANITISQNLFGSTFFTLTGFHGLHVLIGLILLTIISRLVYSGKYVKIETQAFENITMYWHFVDGVWIVVFSVVYIWTMAAA